MPTSDKTIIEELNERIADNCEKIDTDARYDDMLDELYSFEKVGGPFASMSASRVLKEVDPIAYRCGKNDWADGEGFVDVDGDAYEQSEADEQREELRGELQTEIDDLENDMDARREDGGAEDADDAAKLTELTARLRDLNAHTWDNF